MQAKNYYDAEETYYKHKTLILTLVFEWIRHENQVRNIQKHVEAFNDQTDPLTHFVYLIHSNSAGVAVYGNVEAVENISGA